MTTLYDHFFDAQQKRYLMQVVRAFSGIQYGTGRVIDGAPELKQVPCRMAVRDRLAATLMRNGSENVLNTVPLITVARTGLALDKASQGPSSHVDTLQVVERAKDGAGNYLGTRGQAYTIERLMPIALTMTVQVDIWTSNQEQQDQILEQLLIITAIPFDIQNSDNALDWTAITMMELEDITPSSRSVSVGDDDIDIATLTFRLPFKLNPPAKITRQVLINQVVTNVDYQNGNAPDQIVVTPDNNQIAVQRGVVTLLTSGATEADADGKVPTWDAFFAQNRGRLVPAVTQLRLRRNLDDDTRDIIGTLQQSADPNRLDWQIDPETLPANTLPPINAIVRPLVSAPGSNLPAAAAGQRYLVYEDITTSQNWGTVNARANDIIEFQNGVWSVVFRALDAERAYVLNLSTSSQLYWDGVDWEKSIDRIYGPGHWRIYF